MNEEEEVREGFLCPECHLDLQTFPQLEVHYESVHLIKSSNSLSSFKELLGKAKKKILKVGSDEEGQEAAASATNSFEFLNWEQQEEGFRKNHTSTFKEIRNVRTKHYFVEINKLLIRLDKLLSELPTEPAKRKAYEKSMVDWAPDEDVPLCPSCAQRFRMIRRKHHCRLCGSIMCDDCSNFITQTHARKLTSSNMSSEHGGGNIDAIAGALTPIVSFPSILKSLPRSGSLSSLNSIISSSGELHFRLCNHCKSLLDSHNERLEMQNTKPVIEHLYDKLKSSMNEGEMLTPRYFQMVESLRCGATTYTATDVQSFRLKLMRLAETIDVFSKKILLLGTKSEGPPPSERSMRLQKGIFMSANTFLKVKLLGLPSAPSEAEIAEIREQKQREAEQRAKEEQQMLVAAQKLIKRDNASARERPVGLPVGKGRDKSSFPAEVDGWNPESVHLGNNQDPIVQQMNIIRNYIKQAKAAYKLEEVEMLSNNLKELQDEYWRQCDKK